MTGRGRPAVHAWAEGAGQRALAWRRRSTWRRWWWRLSRCTSMIMPLLST